MHRQQWTMILCTAALVASFSKEFGQAQEPAPPPSVSATTSQAPAATSNKPSKKKYSHTNDFLIRGTVFTDKALSFPGVQLRIRRAGEKQFRWASSTNSPSDFTFILPPGP